MTHTESRKPRIIWEPQHLKRMPQAGDPMQSLIRQVSKGFKATGPYGVSEGWSGMAPQRFVELMLENGKANGSTEVVLVHHTETPEALAHRYGHRLLSAGYVYRHYTTEIVRERLREASAE